MSSKNEVLATPGRPRSVRFRRGLVIFLAFAFGIFPLLGGGYWMRVFTVVFVFAIMAESVNVIAGYAGCPAIGNAVFLGTGAYVVGLTMNNWLLPFWAAMPLAGVSCALFALIVGLPLLRLSGRYFLMATLALMEISRQVVINLNFTGGSQGLTYPVLSKGPVFANFFFYYVSFGILLLTIAAVWWISHHNIGLALRAIKYDEEAARTMGINATIYKTAAWSISAFFTGLAGGVFAYFLAYVEPGTVYSMAYTIRMYIEHDFGGGGTVLGPVIGAGILELLSEVVWGRFAELHYLVLGIIIVLITRFVPEGLMKYLNRIPVEGLARRVMGLVRATGGTRRTRE